MAVVLASASAGLAKATPKPTALSPAATRSTPRREVASDTFGGIAEGCVMLISVICERHVTDERADAAIKSGLSCGRRMIIES
jgi:hypothetical protein